MLKRFLLRTPLLWRTNVTTTFTPAPAAYSNNKSASAPLAYMGSIESRHVLYGASYIFPFYWYANTKGMPASYKLLGSYGLTQIVLNAVRESINLASPVTRIKTARPSISEPHAPILASPSSNYKPLRYDRQLERLH